jgi:hypothetical protein
MLGTILVIILSVTGISIAAYYIMRAVNGKKSL